MGPLGDVQAQHKVLYGRMAAMAAAMEQRTHRYNIVRTAYTTNMLTAAAYPGMASLLRQDDYAHIHQHPLELLLHAMGLPMTTKRMTIFADQCYGVAGEKSLWIVAVTGQIKLFMYHMTEQDTTGKILANIMVHLQLLLLS